MLFSIKFSALSSCYNLHHTRHYTLLFYVYYFDMVTMTMTLWDVSNWRQVPKLMAASNTMTYHYNGVDTAQNSPVNLPFISFIQTVWSSFNFGKFSQQLWPESCTMTNDDHFHFYCRPFCILFSSCFVQSSSHKAISISNLSCAIFLRILSRKS